MSRKWDSPVQTQMAVSIFKSPLGTGDYHNTPRIEPKKPTGRRRVFVQTETGCVLGMELERNDNAHTVKRRLQVAVNFPIEESSLSFGDMILKNDLTAIRNDSPLLLTRNLIHRSSSTPCLSPTGRDLQHRDRSGPIEILGHSPRFLKTKQLAKEIVKAMRDGVEPVLVNGGLGGAYYFRNVRGENVAIVKPTDEEPFAPNNPKGFVGRALGQPGLKRSVRVGETGFREVAAYLLDYDHFANVPPTALVKITHSIFNVNDGVNGGNKAHSNEFVSKIASFQQFIPHDFDASDHGTSSFPVTAVHRIGILDVRILNTDRHGGNLLVRKLDGVGQFGQVELVPIDHGLCLPETLEDPFFEWIHWPQSSIPFSDEELEYISGLDPARDSDMLRTELPMIREACLRVLFVCTLFLKEAAAHGLCLAEIGEMMSREFRSGDEEPSELEVVCMEARRFVSEEISFSPVSESDIDGFQFDIEDHDDNAPPKFGSQVFVSHSPLPKLEESIEEEEEEEEGEEIEPENPVNSDRSKSFKATGFCEKNPKIAKQEMGCSSSGQRRSANEQLPVSVSFVNLAEMREMEWALFLEKFPEVLYHAFAKRKSSASGQRQRQRLGTSCQF